MPIHIILSSLFVRPNGLPVRSNLVPGVTYDRLIGKGYLQDWPCADVMTQRQQLLSSVMQVILWPEFELLNKL